MKDQKDTLSQPEGKGKNSPEDLKWVEGIPPHLGNVAREFGRKLFEFCINRRMAQECISHMAGRIKAKDVQQVWLAGLAGSMNRLAQLAQEGQGWSGKDITLCDMALTRAVSLAGQDDRPAIELPPGAH